MYKMNMPSDKELLCHSLFGSNFSSLVVCEIMAKNLATRAVLDGVKHDFPSGDRPQTYLADFVATLAAMHYFGATMPSYFV